MSSWKQTLEIGQSLTKVETSIGPLMATMLAVSGDLSPIRTTFLYF
jgi:hypothetical protein